MVKFNPKKALKKLSRATGADQVDDLLAGARAWMAENTPSLSSATESTARIIAGPTLDPLWKAMDKPTERERVRALREDRGLFGVLTDPLTQTQNVGRGVLEEPILAGVNRAVGIEGGGSSPFSGRQRTATARAIDQIENPLGRIAGEAGLMALDVATDPMTYALPGSSSATGSTARSLGYGALAGAGIGAGGEIAEGLGKDRGTGEAIGGLALPLGVGAGRSALTGAAARRAAIQPETTGTTGGTPARSLLKKLAAGEGRDAKRMYHGTGSAFDVPDPYKFDPAGLYGPGYYLTSDARVASDYALKRAVEGAGANVRSVDVPRGLNLFDAETRMTEQATERLLDRLDPYVRPLVDERLPAGPVTGHEFYRALSFDGDKDGANAILANLGFDGVIYDGGKRTPLRDAAGQAIRHDAVVVFPESLEKITNALSRTEGGFADPAMALRLGLGAAGGVAGWMSGDDDESRWTRAVLGFGAGAAAPTLARTAAGVRRTPKIDTFTVPQHYANMQQGLGQIEANVLRANTGPAIQSPRNLVGGMRQGQRASTIAAADIAASANRLGAVIEEAFRSNQIVPTAEGIKEIARFRTLTDPLAKFLPKQLRQRWEDTSTVPAEFIMQQWTSKTGAPLFMIAPTAGPEVQQAVMGLRGFWDEVVRLERSYGVPHSHLVENYMPRAWQHVSEREGGARGALRRAVHAQQPFQHQRTIDTMLDGLERADLIPRWNTVGDLFEARLNAGVRAMTHKQLVETMQASGWISFAPDPPGGHPSNYRKMEIDALDRVFATIGKSGDPTVMHSKPWVRTDVADEVERFINAAFGSFRLDDNPALRMYSDFNAEMKGMRLGGDLGMALRQGPVSVVATAGMGQGGIRTGGALNPLNWASGISAAYRAFDTAVAGGGIQDFLRDPTNARWAYRLGEAAPKAENITLGYKTGERGLGRIPGVRKLESWQFNEFMPALRVEVAKEMFSRLKGRGRYAGHTDDELEQVVANLVNRVNLHVDPVAQGRSPLTQAVERNLVLSPGTTEGALGLITGALRGEDAALYRRFWANMAVGAVATSVGLSLVLTEDYSPEHIKNLLNPFHPDSVTNPNGRGFLGVELPDGTRWDIWGPMTAIFRAGFSGPVTGAQEGKRALEGGVSVPELLAAVGKGVAGIDTEGRGYREAIPRWLEGRASMPVSLLRDIDRSKDYRGRVITPGETQSERDKQRAWYILNQFNPLASEVFISTEHSAQPEVVVSEVDAWKRGIGQFFGANVRTPNRDPGPIKQTVQQFLATQGLHGGLDPIGVFRRSQEINTKDRQRFLADHPEVTAYIREKRKESAEGLGIPVGRDAVKFYSAQRADLQAARDLAIRTAGDQLTTNQISGSDYRELVGEAWSRYVNGSRALAGSILGVEDIEAAQAKVDRVLGRGKSDMNDMDVLLEKWYGIQPADATSAAREAAAEARQQFIDTLSPQQRQDFMAYRRDRAREIGGEAYARYHDAQQAYAEVAKISPYLGMDAAQARRVSDVLGRARDRQRATPGLPQRTAILLDPRADITTKAWAIRAMGGKLSNPARRLAWSKNASVLSRYYSDLMQDEVEAMTG